MEFCVVHKLNLGMTQYLIKLNVSESPGTIYGYNVVTGEDQLKDFLNLKCTRAKTVGELQYMLLCSNNDDLSHNVDHNIIGNNEFWQIDVRNAKKIYGPSESSLEGKSIKRK